jgi:hypothetical protein
MMPPENTPVPMLVEETGISKITLYHGRKQARAKGLVVPGDGQNPENWSAQYKFAVVVPPEYSIALILLTIFGNRRTCNQGLKPPNIPTHSTNPSPGINPNTFQSTAGVNSSGPSAITAVSW